MDREEMVSRVRNRKAPWDIVVIGGGATGAGIAVDAATRGYDVLLLEREDFGKGTSSRATKLVHGGVRYLEQGNLSLVMEALKERGIGSGLHFLAAHLLTYYRKTFGYTEGSLPVAEKVGSSILSLPLFPDMTDEDVGDVVRAVESILVSRRP